MHPNFLFIPTFLGALIFCWIGFKAFQSTSNVIAWFALATVLAIPALLFVVYYARVLDRSVWFYSFRAAPYTELTASGIGLSLGLVLGLLKRIRSTRDSRPLKLLAPVLVLFCGGLLLVPYIKPIIAPLEVPLKNQWSEGVSLQSTPATCGPSSAATLLRQFNILVSERDLAHECFSYRGGTENWYVARALQRHGLQTQYIVTSPQNAVVPFPSIAGVQIGNMGGHFITILGRRGNSYIVGDPLKGKSVLTAEKLFSKYYFTGFFLVVSMPSKKNPVNN